jgi:hypothetical protein
MTVSGAIYLDAESYDSETATGRNEMAENIAQTKYVANKIVNDIAKEPDMATQKNIAEDIALC